MNPQPQETLMMKISDNNLNLWLEKKRETGDFQLLHHSLLVTTIILLVVKGDRRKASTICLSQN